MGLEPVNSYINDDYTFPEMSLILVRTHKSPVMTIITRPL